MSLSSLVEHAPFSAFFHIRVAVGTTMNQVDLIPLSLSTHLPSISSPLHNSSSVAPHAQRSPFFLKKSLLPLLYHQPFVKMKELNDNRQRSSTNGSGSSINAKHLMSFFRSKKFGISRRSKKPQTKCNFPKSCRTEDHDDDASSFETPQEATTAFEFPKEIAVPVVNLASTRVKDIFDRSPFVQRHQKMHDIPAFSEKDFERGELIGRGAFAHVHRLEHWRCDCDLNEEENWDSQYVIKTIRAVDRAERLALAAADLMMEAYMLSALQHPNIIELRGISSKGITSLQSGRTGGLFLILDRLSCTLYHRLIQWQQTARPQDTLAERLQACLDLSNALAYLHSKNIIYRDLKPGNAGMAVDGRFVLFDFGLALEVPPSNNPNKIYKLASKKGTARYQAPEVIKTNQMYGKKADVFGLSILVWQILALEKPYDTVNKPSVGGGSPFLDNNNNNLESEIIHRRILRGERPPLDHLPPGCVDQIQPFLQRGWSKTISDRPTMREMHCSLLRMQDNMRIVNNILQERL